YVVLLRTRQAALWRLGSRSTQPVLIRFTLRHTRCWAGSTAPEGVKRLVRIHRSLEWTLISYQFEPNFTSLLESHHICCKLLAFMLSITEFLELTILKEGCIHDGFIGLLKLPSSR